MFVWRGFEIINRALVVFTFTAGVRLSPSLVSVRIRAPVPLYSVRTLGDAQHPVSPFRGCAGGFLHVMAACCPVGLGVLCVVVLWNFQVLVGT